MYLEYQSKAYTLHQCNVFRPFIRTLLTCTSLYHNPQKPIIPRGPLPEKKASPIASNVENMKSGLSCSSLENGLIAIRVPFMVKWGSRV